MGLVLPAVGWTQEGEWEWRSELHPMWVWWAIGILAVGLVILWALVSLAPAILAIIGTVLGVRWLLRTTTKSPSDAALAILRERYARGEIGREEFEAKRRDLSAG